MNKECFNCQHKILLEEIYKMSKIVNHHGSETMDSCRFRETFAELCKSIVKKYEEI